MSNLIHFETLTQEDLHHPTHVYLMPHEVVWLERSVEALVGHQQTLGDGLGGAMHEGAETFHDNAPAEALVADSRALVDGGGNMGLYRTYQLRRYSILEYPTTAESVILPGSIAVVWYDETGDDVERFQVGGGLGLNKNGLGRYDTEGLTPDDITQLTYKSALGEALIGLRDGQQFSYLAPTGTTIHARVGAVEQPGITTYLPLLEKIVSEETPQNQHHRNLKYALLTRALTVLVSGTVNLTELEKDAQEDRQSFAT